MATPRRTEVQTPAFSVGSYLRETLAAAGRGLIPNTVVSLLFHLPLLALAWWILAPIVPTSGQDIDRLTAAVARQGKLWASVSTVGGLVIGSFATAAVSYGVIYRLRGEPAGVTACVRATLRRAWALILTSLVLGLLVGLVIIIASVIPMAILIVVARDALAEVEPSSAAKLTILIPMAVISGLIFLFFASRYLVALPVVLVERKGVNKALGESDQLTAGSRLRIAVGMGLYLAVTFALTIFALEPWLAADTRDGALGSLLLTALVNTPLSGCAAAVAYHRLKLHKDGVDVLQAAKVFE